MEDETKRFVQKLEEMAKGTFWDELGCKFELAEGSRVVLSLEIEKRHLNGIGMLHGGVHASLLDNAMGLAAMIARPGEKVVTTNLNLHYLSPLFPGIVTVTAELVHQTRKIITAQGKIEDAQRLLGSWGTGSFRVIGG